MNYKNIIFSVLEPYKPYQIALFGSRARGSHKQNSDYDVMVWWNKKNFPRNKWDTDQMFDDRMYRIADKLSEALGNPVDLVVMKYINKWQNLISDRDQTFYECVKGEAIYYKNVGGNELIDMSIKEGLYKS
jgi:predicted nucleotidyltransferase